MCPFLSANNNKAVVIAYASAGSANRGSVWAAARDAGDALPSACGIVRSRALLGSVGSGNNNDDDIVVRRASGEVTWLPFGEDLAQRILAGAIDDVTNFGSENAQMFSRVRLCSCVCTTNCLMFVYLCVCRSICRCSLPSWPTPRACRTVSPRSVASSAVRYCSFS